MTKAERRAFRKILIGAAAGATIALTVFLYGAQAVAQRFKADQVEIEHLQTQRRTLNHQLRKAKMEMARLPFQDFLAETTMTRDPDFFQTAQAVWKHKGKINPFLIMAVISRESNFDPRAISYLPSQDADGNPTRTPCAYGLMQINYKVWKKQVDFARILEIDYNVEQGTRILKHYLDSNPGDISKALFRYWGGQGEAYTYPPRVLDSKYFRAPLDSTQNNALK